MAVFTFQYKGDVTIVMRRDTELCILLNSYYGFNKSECCLHIQPIKSARQHTRYKEQNVSESQVTLKLLRGILWLLAWVLASGFRIPA